MCRLCRKSACLSVVARHDALLPIDVPVAAVDLQLGTFKIVSSTTFLSVFDTVRFLGFALPSPMTRCSG